MGWKDGSRGTTNEDVACETTMNDARWQRGPLRSADAIEKDAQEDSGNGEAPDRRLDRTRAALWESQQRLAEAQRVAKIGSWSWDLATGTVSWSDELFRMFGLEPAAHAPSFEAQKPRFHPDDSAALESHVTKAWQDGTPYELDFRLVQSNGTFLWVHAVGRAERDEAGAVVRLFGTLMDVDERKALEAELRDRAERLRRSDEERRVVLESAPLILYAASADGTVTLSEGTGLAALGLKAGEVVGRSVFEFSGGDPILTEFTRRALAGEAVSFEARYGRLSLQTELRPVRGADGAPSGMIGVCLDVTDRVRSEERFRVLFEQSSDAHLLFDESGIIDGNPAAVSLLRCESVNRLIGLHPAVLSPEFQPDGRRSDEKSMEMDGLARRNGFHRFEWTHRKLDGEEFPVEVSLTHVTLEGRPVLLVVWHDLTERKAAEREIQRANEALLTQQALLDARLAETAEMNVVLEAQRYQLERANERLEALATTDGLTGVLNHRAFQDRLQAEIERARQTGEPLSLALLDVDRFKVFNDDHGHQAGDEALRSVAAALGGAARKIDVVARYGGEEFAVILVGAASSAAFEAVERLRKAVARITLETGAVTASFGVASLGVSTRREELIEAADRAMYLSKRGGRNRTTLACVAE